MIRFNIEYLTGKEALLAPCCLQLDSRAQTHVPNNSQRSLLLGLEGCVLAAGIEAGAVLGHVGQFAMAYDAGLRVVAMQQL